MDSLKAIKDALMRAETLNDALMLIQGAYVKNVFRGKVVFRCEGVSCAREKFPTAGAGWMDRIIQSTVRKGEMVRTPENRTAIVIWNDCEVCDIECGVDDIVEHIFVYVEV